MGEVSIKLWLALVCHVADSLPFGGHGIYKSECVGSMSKGTSCQPDDLSSIPGTHMREGKNKLSSALRVHAVTQCTPHKMKSLIDRCKKEK